MCAHHPSIHTHTPQTIHKLCLKLNYHLTFESLYLNYARAANSIHVALIVCRIHAEFGAILSYIRGRSMPVGAHAIRHDAIPINAH